ncbi:DUF4391 domain-containing protein [Oceanicaulis alexandrii]|uniref:DUF4391 domain-containing protein n=1 Tax=Oceanicaulis alexandrii TaxID=153233 RepID=UPI003B509EDF
MTGCYEYPKAARFGRVVPKSKIYDAGGLSTKQRQRFVDQVDQINWAYKLAPETINLASSPGVPEIQVFELRMRGSEIDDEVLQAIDKAIPFPILFELQKGEERRLVAAYKRPSEADACKWVVSEHFAADWEPVDKPRNSLPRALDLGGLYDKVLKELIPGAPLEGETLQECASRVEAIRAKKREIERIKSRLAREKQFNKKVAINAELRAASGDLKSLKGGRNGEAE